MSSVLNAVLSLNSIAFISGMNKAESATNHLSKGVKESSREIGELHSSMKNFASGASNAMGKVAGLASALGALKSVQIGVNVVKSGFSEAFDMQGYRNQLETAVKDTNKAGQLMSSAINYANLTPFETGEVVQAASQLEAYGISSTKWLSRVGDMAGATNKTVNQASEAMADAAIGEFERLEEFGIRKDEVMAASAAKYGKSVVFDSKGHMLDQIKMMTVLQEIMDKKFKGGAEKQSKTIRGMWSTITGVTKTGMAQILGISTQGKTAGEIIKGSFLDKVHDGVSQVAAKFTTWQNDGTFASIGNKVSAMSTNIKNSFINDVIPAFKGAKDFILTELIPRFNTLKDNIMGISDKALTSLKGSMGKTKISASELFTNGLDKVNGALKWVNENYGSVTSAIGLMSDAYKIHAAAVTLSKVATIAHNVVTGIAKAKDIALTGAIIGLYTAQYTATAAQWLLNTAMSANPIALVVIVVGALVGAFVLAYKKSDKFRNGVIALWDGLKRGAETCINFVIDRINDLIGGINKVVGLINKIPGVEIGSVGSIGHVDIKTSAESMKTFSDSASRSYEAMYDKQKREDDFLKSKISKNANGTSYFNGGASLVNERGGEMQILRNGTSVIPADRTKQMLENNNSNKVSVIIQNLNYGGNDKEEFANWFIDTLKKRLSNI